jgi:dextranase
MGSMAGAEGQIPLASVHQGQVPLVSVHELLPERPWARPGTSVSVTATLDTDRRRMVRLVLELLDVDVLSARRTIRRRLPVGRTTVRIGIQLPPVARRGYGLRLTIQDTTGVVLATAITSVEALAGWWESPRHVALVEHTDAGTRHVPGLRPWHVNVAQAYDWMWRHYRYEPPAGQDPFTDALGRIVSHRALRATIRAAERSGIATLAYGSVYGAEAEHVATHPEDRVFDEQRQPLSLGGTFFINDLRPGSSWRRRLLAEYGRAMRHFGFGGIHMDTYGPPYTAVGSDGRPLAFRELYAGLIEEAAGVVGSVREGRVLFNCVEGFPLEDVAAAPMAALYLELWPPDDRFGHLVGWIDRAHAVADGRQVVIAAYGAPMRGARTPVERARALEATLLTTCVITSAGAYHHTLAEDDRLLVDGYYPAAIRLRRTEARELQAAWRFGARYLHLLSATIPDLDLGRSIALSDRAGRPVATSAQPVAGAVWVRATRTPGGRPVLLLVDLRAQTDDRWDAGRQPSPVVTGWHLSTDIHEPLAASPWTDAGDPARLRAESPGTWRLPRFRRWLMIAGTALEGLEPCTSR